MREGHFNTVKLLLVAGADLDIQDSVSRHLISQTSTIILVSD